MGGQTGGRDAPFLFLLLPKHAKPHYFLAPGDKYTYRVNTMAQQTINIGALPNDGTGDPLRVAYGKINNNFDQLFAAASQYVARIIPGSGVTISPTTGIGEVTINLFQSLEVDGEGANAVNPDQLIVDGGYA